MTRIAMIAHRGASYHAPENTFAAADKAIVLGAAHVELDVRESADGILYVLHDRTVDRTTNGSGEIAAMTAADIDRLDAGRWFGPSFAGQPVPRLDAFLDHLRGRAGAYVELKWCDPEKVARTIRAAGMADAVLWFAYKPEMRDGMRAAAPEMRQVITLDIVRSPAMARPVFGASVVEMEVDQMRPAILTACRAHGLGTMAYYEGREPVIFRAIARSGVDFANLDHPDLYAAVEEVTPC